VGRHESSNSLRGESPLSESSGRQNAPTNATFHVQPCLTLCPRQLSPRATSLSSHPLTQSGPNTAARTTLCSGSSVMPRSGLPSAPLVGRKRTISCSLESSLSNYSTNARSFPRNPVRHSLRRLYHPPWQEVLPTTLYLGSVDTSTITSNVRVRSVHPHIVQRLTFLTDRNSAISDNIENMIDEGYAAAEPKYVYLTHCAPPCSSCFVRFSHVTVIDVRYQAVSTAKQS